MDTEFNTKPTYGDDDKYIKTKIKTYEDNITTNFYNKKEFEKSTRRKNTTQMFINNNSRFCPLCICAYEKYNPQIFLEECKYVIVILIMKNKFRKK